MRTPHGPNINVKQLRAVQAVAKYSSFIAAAAELRMSQPGLSRLIRTVESELGAALFHRSTRHVSLTSMGSEFLPYVERILNDIESAANAMKAKDDQVRGQVSISCPMSIAHGPLAPIISDYRRRFPNVLIEIREGHQGAILSEIHSGGVDFGIAISIDLDEDLVSTELCGTAFYVLFRRDHPFLHRKRLSLSDLRDESLVSLPASSNLRWILDGAAALEGFRLKHAITVNTYNTIFSLIRADGYVSVISSASVALANARTLAARPIHLNGSIGRLATIRLRKRQLTPAADTLKKMVDNYFYVPS